MLQSSVIELIGALITYLSVISAIKEKRITWVWAILSALFYAYIYWSSGLVVSAEVQLLYLGISFYGLYRWQNHQGTDKPKEEIKPGTFSLNLFTLVSVLLATGALYALNRTVSQAEWVLYDALLVASAIVAQGLMAKKYISCWYLWIFVNLGYLPLFYAQELWISLLLYLVLLRFTFKGAVEWHQKLNKGRTISLA